MVFGKIKTRNSHAFMLAMQIDLSETELSGDMFHGARK